MLCIWPSGQINSMQMKIMLISLDYAMHGRLKTGASDVSW